jgi:hypothetical protein
VLSSGKQTPKSRWSKVNLGESFHSRCRAFTYKSPSAETPSYRASRHLYSTEYVGSHSATSLRGFADRGIHDSKSPAAGNPECRIPDALDSCHLSCSDRRSRLNRGIALRDFDVHGILALTNPDSPICDDQGFFRCRRVNPLAPSPRSSGSRDFVSLLDDSSRRFSSSLKRPSLAYFARCN